MPEQLPDEQQVEMYRDLIKKIGPRKLIGAIWRAREDVLHDANSRMPELLDAATQENSGLFRIWLGICSLFLHLLLSGLVIWAGILTFVPALVIYIGFQEQHMPQWMTGELLAAALQIAFLMIGVGYEASFEGGLMVWLWFIVITFLVYALRVVYQKIKSVKNIPSLSFKKKIMILAMLLGVLYGGAAAFIAVINKGVQFFEFSVFFLFLYVLALMFWSGVLGLGSALSFIKNNFSTWK